MDNKLFNFNGTDFYEFNLALQLLLSEREEDLSFDVDSRYGRIGVGVSGYKFDYSKGLILYWYIDDRLEQKGVKSIEELVKPDKLDPKLTKSLRKYKLALLNDDIKKRVSIPFELLVHSLWNWFQEFNEWDKIEYGDWEDNVDHDGSNEKGFRIYKEDWGCVNVDKYGIDHYTIAAIKPVYCWYGK